jgi:hypothetical protein
MERPFCIGAISAAIGIVFLNCTTVKIDTIRLTMENFPPQEPSQVSVLTRLPSRGYEEIADLAARGDSADFEDFREKIVERAAELGADAVVLSNLAEYTKQGIAYTPAYSPWGYQNPYGPDPWGYNDVGYGGLGYGGYGYVDQPYEVRIHSLKGTAIRHTSASSSQ